MPPKQKRKQPPPKITQRAGQGRIEQRKRFPLVENRQNITNGDIRRMARRGGVKRISRDVYPLSREFMKMYVSDILNDAMIYANYASRNTLIADDIIRAAKRHGQNALGFNELY